MLLSKKWLSMKRYLFIVVVITLLIVSSLLAGCTSNATAVVVKQPQPSTSSSTTVAVSASSLFDEAATVSIYEQCIPAVVQIESTVEITSKLPSPFNLGTPKQEGLGSGFIIDGQGHILTNFHVVNNASTVKVVLNDGTKLDAKIVGTDNHNDLALLQIDTSKVNSIKYLTMGDSSIVKPGQMSIALGSPYGLQGSITVGIVSGIGRSIPGSSDRTMTNIIQTDAAINPGNSGGPLLNSKSEVIGINTAIESDANGVGFAVPINTAKTLLPELLKGGAVKTAWLGIEGTPVNKELVEKLQLKADKGVYVVGVLSGSPAEKAGIIKGGRDGLSEPSAGGDIITALDNVPVTKVQDMISIFNNKRPGDKITLSVQRGDQQISVPVELGEWPDNLRNLTIDNLDQNQNNDNGNGFDFGPFHFRTK